MSRWGNNMKNIRNLGNRIKYVCDEKGVSHDKLSELLNCSVSDIRMSLFGRKFFSYQQIEKIADLLGISVDALLVESLQLQASYAMDCMNEFTHPENCEMILDLIYDYLDVYESVNLQ